MLFELGRGIQHRDVVKSNSPSEGEVLEQIEKIHFGRIYRDLVKVCLTESLYATSEINIDTQFNRVVVEKQVVRSPDSIVFIYFSLSD